MIIAIPKEINTNETRVAATPETVKKMCTWGYEVHLEHRAGEQAGFSDSAYEQAGAKIMPCPQEVYQNADIVLKIRAPQESEYHYITPDMTIIADFELRTFPKRTEQFAKLGATCFALDKLPRISRAQAMDILSSQSNLSGYKAVLEAINLSPKIAPLMMTAAGTIPPAKVLVLGVGVAGLQAIATAKRLGAQVFASDVRQEVKEQVESLGARFVEVDSQENFTTSSGYAAETSADYQQKQKQAVTEQLKKTDIVITTALIPGKKAPILVTQEMLDQMPEGAILIDMATSNGGNIVGSQDNQTLEINGKTILGNSNLAAKLPHTASRLFANNIYNFLNSMYHTEKKQIIFNFFDELIDKACICKDGVTR